VRQDDNVETAFDLLFVRLFDGAALRRGRRALFFWLLPAYSVTL
jgi:hypothetical protein